MVEDTTLMNAVAFVVGPDDGPGAALRDLARLVGFTSVLPFENLPAVARDSADKLAFFLFSAVSRNSKLRSHAETIRGSDVPQIRFAPMIYFSESPSLAAIRGCIEMGFDDVITQPFTMTRVSERLGRQVSQPMTYYETANYFGPDRHDRIKGDPGHPRRGSGGQYRRMEIVRQPAGGVAVIRDDMHVVL